MCVNICVFHRALWLCLAFFLHMDVEKWSPMFLLLCPWYFGCKTHRHTISVFLYLIFHSWFHIFEGSCDFICLWQKPLKVTAPKVQWHTQMFIISLRSSNKTLLNYTWHFVFCYLHNDNTHRENNSFNLVKNILYLQSVLKI